MDFCFLKPSQGETKLGSPLILITYGEDQNLHYGCAYTPHY